MAGTVGNSTMPPAIDLNTHRGKSMIYRVEYMRSNSTNWTLSSDSESKDVAIQSARSVARQPNRERVRVVDANGSLIWMS